MWMRISTRSPFRPCILPPATDASHIASIPYAIPIFEAIIKVHDLPVDRTRWRGRIPSALRSGPSRAGNERERISDWNLVRERVRLLHHWRAGAPVHEHATVARFTGAIDSRFLWRVFPLFFRFFAKAPFVWGRGAWVRDQVIWIGRRAVCYL